MDKETVSRWNWLPTAMPKVAKLIREKRVSMGDAHVNECWQRGVVKGEPGWFFAREGPLMVGVPWRPEDMVQIAWPTEALLMLREVEHGAP